MTPAIRIFIFTLQAGTSQRLAIYGNYIRVLSNSSPTNPNVAIGDVGYEALPAGIGVKLPSGENYKYVDFENTTLGVMTLEVAFSLEQIDDSRLTLTGTVQVSMAGLSPAKGFDLIAVSNVAPGTVVVAANSARRSVIIRNLKNNGGDMYIGFANTLTATKYAICLSPGEAYTNSDYTGAIYALATVNAEKVSYGEV